jgi:hypothetical protein
VAIQFLLGRIAIWHFLTKVGCSDGGDEHQLAGAGPIQFRRLLGDEKAGDFQLGGTTMLLSNYMPGIVKRATGRKDLLNDL